MAQDKFTDPAERLTHYLEHAVEKQKDIAAKEVSDLLKTVKENTETAQSKQKKYHDAKHGAGLSFKLNAIVLKKDF